MWVGALLVFVALQACVPARQTGTAYSREEARHLQQIELGTVVEVTPVVIEGTKTGAGGAVGGAVGGIAGSASSSGTAGEIVGVLAGVAGAVVGAKVEEAVTSANGAEYTIRLESGEVISVVQAIDNKAEPITAGDRVKLLSQHGTYRVTRLATQ
ncbi:MAG: hypothetical protein KJP25_11690 [Gammaproteobacteria bacterium]|nr:hypothetical protein [Gammaproteobacteria bacterium]MBT8151156.1 hypothetical protein [Gammaproteobacteria bacterium]NND38243.1 hypothetical protein [Pseudomonadales bacterium]NNM12025.1 hypothetical protein [Pseudomonadales bacterium]RZV50114.1 MAG: hypothetical protein EX270_11790 [Pseudomonadales bacterium]